jgi:hypothetical protein
MGSSSAPRIEDIEEAPVAAVAKDPEVADNQMAQKQARQRKRGISASYTNRYAANNKEKLGV